VTVLRYLLEAEYLDQVDRYEERTAALGEHFIRAVRAAEDRIVSNPRLYALVDGSKEIRGAVVEIFPFRLLYTARDGEVLVIAVAHTSREPKQFLDRT
jgi:plasmid stabilization system protein ParE